MDQRRVFAQLQDVQRYRRAHPDERDDPFIEGLVYGLAYALGDLLVEPAQELDRRAGRWAKAEGRDPGVTPFWLRD